MDVYNEIKKALKNEGIDFTEEWLDNGTYGFAINTGDDTDEDGNRLYIGATILAEAMSIIGGILQDNYEVDDEEPGFNLSFRFDHEYNRYLIVFTELD